MRRSVPGMDDIRAITATMNVAASAADVWQTMTDPHRLALWFGTLAGVGEPGGEVDIDVTATAEQVTAVITRCDVSERLTLGWSVDGDRSTVDVTLTPAADGTVVTLTESDVPNAYADVYEHGWTSHLARLAAATTGDALPEWTAKES